MLRATDVVAGKIVVQMGLCPPDTVREVLRLLDQDADPRWDLVNGLVHRGALDPSAVAFVRHRTALYEHVRREAIYVRLLERDTTIKKEKVAKLLAQLERASFRRRLGDVLVRRGNLRPEDDRDLVDEQQRVLARDDERVLSRYRREDFAGVEKPLVPGSRSLDPEEFKISTLFRSKATRALVDKAELELLREVARRRGAAHPPSAKDADRPTGQAPAVDPYAETAKVDPQAVAAAKADAEAGVSSAAPAAGLPSAQPVLASPDDVRKLQRIGDYGVVEVLGVGGMGAVFLGQKDGAGELVAIKVLLNQAASEEEKGRFQREIDLTRRVQHPNVIHIIETGTTPSGLSYVVVPALAGRELRDLLEQAGGQPLNPELTAPIFTQILEGMQAVHEAGIVHRDLKPENVFVVAGGQHEVKIMDFGLAKPTTERQDELNVFLTSTGEVSGSPAYMAPESVTNDPIDGRTDIYSLGVMLFELLTGKLPLESETSQGYLSQHLICPPLTLVEARPELEWPAELEELVASMLAKTREERPPSCRAILERFGAGLAIKIRELRPAADAEDTGLDLQSTPQLDGWGFKGLLGRLVGRR
ncbi:MAG: serine/threonine protein kinase [Planctomycetota bacterium]|nr:MAG: serine/threonine protein kinase [Planctomycetota bacterium]